MILADDFMFISLDYFEAVYRLYNNIHRVLITKYIVYQRMKLFHVQYINGQIYCCKVETLSLNKHYIIYNIHRILTAKIYSISPNEIISRTVYQQTNLSL